MNEHVAIKLPLDAHDVDVYAWTRSQADLLRSKRFEAIDLDNIIEEIESLGSEQAHAIESHLIIAVEHLLKLAVSADQQPRRGWRNSVRNARHEIERRLKRNPSLWRELQGFYAEEWTTMRDRAAAGLRDEEEAAVPSRPLFTVEQILDPDFFLTTNPA